MVTTEIQLAITSSTNNAKRNIMNTITRNTMNNDNNNKVTINNYKDM